MRIVPAVDIRGGLCVNLVQGDYGQETVFSQDPIAQARLWHKQGAELVHIVDLDGAKAGYLCIDGYLRQLAREAIPYEVGGGIRDMTALESTFCAGANRAILGTIAYRDPAFVQRAAKLYRGRVVVGIDARDGWVALNGWLDVTETDAVAFAREMEAAGAARIIYTDIKSDGMMKGPNIEATRRLAEAVSIPVTASGGISSLENIRQLAALQTVGVDEAIVGRALYLGAFTLPEALETAGAAAV